MTYLLTAVGIIFFLNGIFMFTYSNLTLGVVLTAVLGLLFFCWGIFYRKIQTLTSTGAPKIIKNIIIFMICAEFVLVGFVAIYGQSDTVDYTEDALIVLGAGLRGDRVSLPLRYRLDKAVEYHKKNPDAIIIVTGGKGFQELVTEAYAMEQYLIGCGIPKDKIIKEEAATSTNENMRFSKQILDKYFEGDYKVAVVTNNFHIYRSVSIAKIEGFQDVSRLHAPLQWYNLIPCYIRESLAILKMWVFG